MVWEFWVMKMVLEVCGHSKKLYETSATSRALLVGWKEMSTTRMTVDR